LRTFRKFLKIKNPTNSYSFQYNENGFFLIGLVC
jgi:hypothetical protein